MDFLEKFFENFFENFLKSHFSSQFQVVYITMTTAYIDMTFKITKTVSQKRFCELTEGKRVKIVFNI